MTEQSNNHSLPESLSALADGEASSLELHRLLKASETDPEVKATWSRYQLISSAMRRDLPAFEASDLAARVSLALDDEASHKSASGKMSHWWQNLGRVGVAASVAVAALVGVQQFPGGTAEPELASSERVEQGVQVVQEESQNRPAVSLPAGYAGQGTAAAPLARTASAQSGYDPRPQEARQVLFVPRQESVPVNVEEIRAHLNQLIQEHSDHAVLNSNHGALPYARVVADDED